MANLFTAVSAEQQEIVAGGDADKFKLDDLIMTTFNQQLFNITANAASGLDGSTVGQGLVRNITTTDAKKDLTLDIK